MANNIEIFPRKSIKLDRPNFKKRVFVQFIKLHTNINRFLFVNLTIAKLNPSRHPRRNREKYCLWSILLKEKFIV